MKEAVDACIECGKKLYPGVVLPKGITLKIVMCMWCGEKKPVAFGGDWYITEKYYTKKVC